MSINITPAQDKLFCVRNDEDCLVVRCKTCNISHTFCGDGERRAKGEADFRQDHAHVKVVPFVQEVCNGRRSNVLINSMDLEFN